MSKAKQAAYAAAQQNSSSGAYGFASGFLLGQLTLALILFLFIKFFIFGEPPSADARAANRAAVRRQRTLSHSASLRRRSVSDLRRKSSLLGLNGPSPATRITGGQNILTTEQILAKTYYNVDGHQPESLDWFNVLVAQTIAQLRADALQDNAVLDSLTSALNGTSRPDFLDEIRVTDISLGEEFPIFSNCRVIPVDEDGTVLPTSHRHGKSGRAGAGPARGERSGGVGESRLQARMDVDLSDVVTLGIETKLVLNYPKPFSAVLPVALAVSVVRFSGTLSLSFTPSQVPEPSSADQKTGAHHGASSSSSSSASASASASRSPTTLAFTFLDDYRLDLSVHSLIGSRSRLQDVPKIAQLVEQRIHNWFDERCVEPRFQQIVLPSLWPRKKNVRGGGEDAVPSTSPISPDATPEPAMGSLPTPSPSPTPTDNPADLSDGERRKPPVVPPGVHDWAAKQNGHLKPSAASSSTQQRHSSRSPSPAHNQPSHRDSRPEGLRRRHTEGFGLGLGGWKKSPAINLDANEDELEAAGAEMRAAEERQWEKERRSRERSAAKKAAQARS